MELERVQWESQKPIIRAEAEAQLLDKVCHDTKRFSAGCFQGDAALRKVSTLLCLGVVMRPNAQLLDKARPDLWLQLTSSAG